MKKEDVYFFILFGWILGFLTCVILSQFFPIINFL